MALFAKRWLLSLSLSLSLATSVAAQAPDLILHIGKVVTVDNSFSIANAVAIRGDRIVTVGANEEINDAMEEMDKYTVVKAAIAFS